MKSFRAQTDQAIKNLDERVRVLTSSLDDAVEEAAEVFVEEAQRRVAVRSGLLRSRIKHKPHLRTRTRAVEMVYVNSRYAHLVEYGHRRPGDMIAPLRGRALKTGANEFAASSRGGAASARPFMRPAMDSKANEMGRRIAVITVQRVKGRASAIGKNYR